MTEVDAVIPDNVATLQQQVESRTTNSPEITTATTNNVDMPTKDQLNGDKIKGSTEKLDAMDVDAPDTEEDDSQITSSSENGIAIGGEDSKMSEAREKRQLSEPTSSENSKDESLNDADSIVVKNKLRDMSKSNPSSSNEDSSNACDEVSQNCDNSPFNKADQNSDSELPAAVDTEEGENSTASGTNNVKRTFNNLDKDKENTDGVADVDAASQDVSSDAKSNSRQQDFNEDMISIEAKDEKSTEVPVDDCTVSQQSAEDPLNSAEIEKEIGNKSPVHKENGTASESEKAKDDAGIVDLGDDSDEEMEEIIPAETARNLKQTANGSDSALNYSSKKTKSVCSDSDGAVIIGSDSENEQEELPSSKQSQKPDAEKAIMPQEIPDDDDDDCVVIEDDTPAPPALLEVSKRKSMTVDLATNSDDSQPPNKRQRTSLQSNAVSQITIKDARSLMPQDISIASKEISNDTGSIYPVNIRPSTTITSVSSPPKLVPVSNTASIQPVSTGTTLSGLNSNTNLLPGLTDDMFVLEAPSFIVPYIYEKPPTDNLREVVKGIETKYELTKDDLAVADKSDEFDMMTEQNKEDKSEKSGKKKKRRHEGEDESWSEESEEDDDEEDDDSDGGGVRTKVLIKEANDDLLTLKGAIKPAAAVAFDPATSSGNMPSKPGQDNYFESPLGKFFMDIGVGLVQEFVQSDLIRLQKRKMRKSLGKNITEFERAIAALSGNLEASKKKNSPFKFTMKRCEFCNFKSESALSMANHYETPHMNGQLFKCNFCIYEIRSDKEIVYHMEAVHNIKARLIKPLPYHQCPNCSFEDNGKAKMARHQPVCAKKFRPELNLSPPHDWEAPAKIPRIKPRHGLVGTATAYQAMAAQAAAQKAALASIQQQQQQAAQARSIQAAALAAQNAANKIRGRPPTITKAGPNPSSPQMRGPNQVRNPMATNVVMSPNNYQLAGAQLIQNANALAKKTLSGQPSISITPLPRQSSSAQVSSASSSKMPPAGMKPGQSPSGNKAQFVICEICDGYIKDLEQLRNHMQWMHKVKIHPKMIYNRPPLNCQKCQFRFFTDQGLERHLLGSHGLVTSSMQEAANKGKDAGRCPVCGRLYQWKLLNHVSRDHHMTLKPAHLSYKCTVCTATFGMYKQFETHVYTAHSTVAKKAMDGKKNNNASPSSTMTSGSQRSSLGATNDSLLKPLKINDEITIIPQPSSKPRITNMESHVID